MKKYISNGTWFKKESVVELIEDFGNGSGLFKGIRICENPLSEGNHHFVGEEYLDEELCTFDEFTEKEQ